jgi:hypothetical protein
MDVIQLIIKDIHIDLPIATSLKVQLKRNQSSTASRFIVSRVAAGYNHCKTLQPSACIPIGITLNLQSAATGVRSFATASLLFDGLLSLQSLLFQTSPE